MVGGRTLADSVRMDEDEDLDDEESAVPVQQGRKKEDGKFGKKGLSFDDAYLERVFAASRKATRRYMGKRNQLFLSFIKVGVRFWVLVSTGLVIIVSQ